MIACVDAHYRLDESVAACVGLSDWSDESIAFERVIHVPRPAEPYVPSEFYLREMQPILQLLHDVEGVEAVVVDGYVWLAKDRPGLGARLHEALGGTTPVVGVAKHAFRNNDRALAVLRGRSTRALYVTAIGMDESQAVACLRRMHGKFRIPTALKRVDQLTRT